MDICRKDADIDDLKKAFAELSLIVDRLRNEGGCPWDRKQTIDDTKEFFLEEVYELIAEIDKKDFSGIEEELGDLFLLCLFLARICEEKGRFSVVDALKNVSSKLIRRHPHVFGSENIRDAEEVMKRWTEIKEGEKKRKSIWDSVPVHSPSLFQYFIFLKELNKRSDIDSVSLPDERNIDVAGEKQRLIKAAEALQSADRDDEYLREILLSVVRISKALSINPEMLFSQYIRDRRERLD